MNMMETMSGRCQTAGNVSCGIKRLVLSCRILDCLAMIRCFEISVCRKSSLELIRKALIKSTGIAAAGWSGRTGTQKGEPVIRRSETAGGNLQSLGYGCRGDRRG